MTLLRDKHSHHFDLCMKKNQTMIEWNDTFTKSASSIIEEISSVNLSLAEKGKSVKHNDLMIAESMETARLTLDDLNDTSKSHSSATTEFVRKVEDNMKNLSKLDLKAGRIVDRLSEDKENCVDQLNQSLLEKTEDSINLLASTGRYLGIYGSSVILPECSTALDKMEIPRVKTIKEFKSVRQKINERIEIFNRKFGKLH